jgi:CBS domain-containing protein
MWEIARLRSDLTLGGVVIKANDVTTVTAGSTLEDAGRILVGNGIRSLPVLEDSVVVAILTETDLLAQLLSLLGGNTKGVRVTIRMPDRIGEFAKVAGALADKGTGIYATGVPATKGPGYWDFAVNVRDVADDDSVGALSAVPDQRVIDAREM